jgi:hypothetical protein
MMNSAMLVVAIVLHAFFLTASTASIHGSWDGALDKNTTNVESHRDLCGFHPNNEEDFDNSFVTTLNFRQIGPALNVNESNMIDVNAFSYISQINLCPPMKLATI